MIGKAGLAMLALLAMGQSSPGAPEGAIVVSLGPDPMMSGSRLAFRIVPDGRMTLNALWRQAGDEAAPPIRQDLERDVGFSGYRRISALVAPLRRWKGAVPCDRPRPPAGSPFGAQADVMMAVRWEVDGTTVQVPITCGFGPAENDIELGRAAFDQLRAWGRPDSGFNEDGPTNTSNVIEHDANGQVAD